MQLIKQQTLTYFKGFTLEPQVSETRICLGSVFMY